MIRRSAEATAFLETVAAADPRAVSVCEGWTTHEIAAHVTGIAVEVTRHLEPFLNGEPVPETRGFEEREAPLQALPHDELLNKLDHEEDRMRRTVDLALQGDPEARIRWTGRQMSVAKFIPHLRNEHALHRWDVAGEDEASGELLGSHDLVDHSVDELGEILLRAGRKSDPEPDAPFAVALRSDGQPDLQIVVDSGRARIQWAEEVMDQPTVEMSAAARHLFIWGRRPDRHGVAQSRMSRPSLARLQALLSGY
jgi:hypothetical protein